MDRATAELLERADSLRRAGRLDEAIAAYTELLGREPDMPDSWYNLGWLRRQARQFEEALEAYAEALRRGAAHPEEIHLNRAVILSDQLARPEEAEVELRTALEHNPGFVPALLNLGNLYEDFGRRDEAEQAYRKALDIAPDDSLALSRLAGVVDAKSDAGSEVAGQIERAIDSGRGPAELADLSFALARILDARGEFSKAFATADAANRASRASFGPRFRAYDRAEQERYVDRQIAAFPEPAKGEPGEAPAIYICGMFRSGSTLIEQILSGHSRIASGGELDVIPALVARIEGYPGAVAEADRERVQGWRDFYLAGLPGCDRGTCFITDKRPDNFLHIGLIKTLFPGAKIVHTRRDRLDNLVSLHFLHLGPAMPYALDLADSAHWHGQYERLMAHWKSLYPNDIFDVDYDRLVRGPKPVVERLLAFLGLGWEDSLLEIDQRQGPVKTASVWQVREPIHARSSGRWRHYSEQLKLRLGKIG